MSLPTDGFVKRWADAPPGFFASEAAGLAWLAEAEPLGGCPVPAVLEVARDHIVVQRVPGTRPVPDRAGGAGLDESTAERLGRELAMTHGAGAAGFGDPTPRFVGLLALPRLLPQDAWEAWWRELLEPLLQQARDAGALDRGGATAIRAVLDDLGRLAGPPEPPSRLHGDLWRGNVVVGHDRGGGHRPRAWLVDPAAHGGHRETDLAMLALFGLPHLDRVIAAYDEAAPLAPGWRQRVALHQLYPLLVHACLFGPGYGAQAAAAARRLLGH